MARKIERKIGVRRASGVPGVRKRPLSFEGRKKLHLRQLKERAPAMREFVGRELVKQGIKREWIRRLEADPEYRKLKDEYYEGLAKILAKHRAP